MISIDDAIGNEEFLSKEFVSSGGNVRLTRSQLRTVIGVKDVESLTNEFMSELVEYVWEVFSDTMCIEEFSMIDCDDYTVCMFWELVKEVINDKLGI